MSIIEIIFGIVRFLSEAAFALRDLMKSAYLRMSEKVGSGEEDQEVRNRSKTSFGIGIVFLGGIGSYGSYGSFGSYRGQKRGLLGSK